jgi:hypothetical protein
MSIVARNLTSAAGHHSLKRGDLLQILQRSGGTDIRCEQGQLWITGGPDGGDFFLAPGQFVRILGRSRIVVEALEDAEFTIGRTDR